MMPEDARIVVWEVPGGRLRAGPFCLLHVVEPLEKLRALGRSPICEGVPDGLQARDSN